MKITILASGSKGNSTLIETKDKNILIDAGLPLSNLEKRINSIKEKINRITSISSGLIKEYVVKLVSKAIDKGIKPLEILKLCATMSIYSNKEEKHNGLYNQ